MSQNKNIGFYLGVISILILAFYLRAIGLDWDEGQQLHPDERFLNMVEGSVKWSLSWQAFLDTEHSTINPHNAGHNFFVYGTLPIFIIRGIIELLGRNDIPLHMVGRWVSVFADLSAVFLTCLMGYRLFGAAAGLFAGLLLATSVTNIQQAHFGVVDAFTGSLVVVALYIAVIISQIKDTNRLKLASLSVLFGLATGAAAGSKIPSAMVAAWIGLALLIRSRSIKQLLAYSAIAAFVCLVSFRIFQPYAFTGPGFFDLELNPKWLANLQELKRLVVPTLGFPPAVQWMYRSKSYAFVNMFHWGAGEAAFIVVWLGLFYGIYKLIRTKETCLIIPVTWALASFFYFGVLTYNPTLRYQIPAYPAFALCGGWLLSEIIKQVRFRVVYQLIAIIVITYSIAWAFAFVTIYTKPHPRVEASRWIIRNIPGAVSLVGYHNNQKVYWPVPTNREVDLIPDSPSTVTFGISNPFAAFGLHLSTYSSNIEPLIPSGEIVGSIYSGHGGGGTLIGWGSGAFSKKGVDINFKNTAVLNGFSPYTIVFHPQNLSQSVKLTKKRIAHETSWDDGLPLRVDGFDPYGGIYEGGLNLELYWDDNEAKADKIAQELDKADYLFITSNRQWGSIGRLPQHYPLTHKFYELLLGCPTDSDLLKCYAEAESEDKGTFPLLSYKLIKTFESYPELGGIRFNDQLADEAFTVYDHPKVLIFEKQSSYSAERISKILKAALR